MPGLLVHPFFDDRSTSPAMIAYDPREWFRPVFLIHQAETFRKLWPLLLLCGGYSAGVAYLEVEHLNLATDRFMKNIPMMHSLLGFAISMLLVFRTNTAYDRWWEGRKQWGALVNASRNLAAKLGAMLDPTDQEDRTFFARLIGLFPIELKQHLQEERTRLELDDKPHPEIPDFDRARHVPSQIVALLQQRLSRLQRDGRLSGEQLLLLNPDLTALLDICGACERIKNSPIPYSYSSFIKKFIVIYVLTLPLGVVFALGYITIPVTMFIFYVLASMELIAEEIEDPFGKDTNDLPMDRMATTITRNVQEILL